MKKPSIAILLLSLVAVLITVYLINFDNTGENNKITSRANKPNNQSVDISSSITTTNKPIRRLDINDIQHILKLDGIKFKSVLQAIDWLAEDLNEEKGINAKIFIHSNDRIDIAVPKLVRSETDIKNIIENRLSNIIGSQLAVEAVANNEVLTLVKERLHIHILSSDEYYKFLRLKPEGDIENLGSAANATFEVVINRQSDNPENNKLPDYKQLNFTIEDAGKPSSISWTAMALAPNGYFRSSIINGVSSRPQRSYFTVYQDLDSKSTVIQDLTDSSKKTVLPWNK